MIKSTIKILFTFLFFNSFAFVLFAECVSTFPESGVCKDQKNYINLACEGRSKEVLTSTNGSALPSDYSKCLDKHTDKWLEAKADSLKKKEKPESCDDTNKDYAGLIDACKVIAESDLDEDNRKNKNEILKQCKARRDACLGFAKDASEADEDDLKACAWLAKKGKTAEGIEAVNDSINDKKAELMKSFSQSQVSQQEEIENRRKRGKLIQEQINSEMAAIQQIYLDMQTSDIESVQGETETLRKFKESRRKINAELKNESITKLSRIEESYHLALENALRKCRVKAKAKYDARKSEFQKKISSNKGISIAQYSKWSQKNRVKMYNSFENSCLSGTEYYEELDRAARDRKNAILESSVNVSNLKDQLTSVAQDMNDAIGMLRKSKSSQARQFEKNLIMRKQNISRLQNEIQSISNPDKSTMVGMMQQQQTSIREFQSLDQMAEKNARISGIPLDKDDFSLLKMLSSMESEPVKDSEGNYLTPENSITNDADEADTEMVSYLTKDFKACNDIKPRKANASKPKNNGKAQ